MVGALALLFAHERLVRLVVHEEALRGGGVPRLGVLEPMIRHRRELTALKLLRQLALLELLLDAPCRLAMPLDKYDRSPLRIAVENGKWRSLQLLLDALRRKRFSILPAPMRVVSESMQAMAYK